MSNTKRRRSGVIIKNTIRQRSDETKNGVAAKALCATHGGALNKTTDLIDELLHFG